MRRDCDPARASSCGAVASHGGARAPRGRDVATPPGRGATPRGLLALAMLGQRSAAMRMGGAPGTMLWLRAWACPSPGREARLLLVRYCSRHDGGGSCHRHWAGGPGLQPRAPRQEPRSGPTDTARGDGTSGRAAAPGGWPEPQLTRWKVCEPDSESKERHAPVGQWLFGRPPAPRPVASALASGPGARARAHTCHCGMSWRVQRFGGKLESRRVEPGSCALGRVLGRGFCAGLWARLSLRGQGAWLAAAERNCD